MKTTITITLIVAVLLIGCKEETKENTNNVATTSEILIPEKKAKNEHNGTLPQNGDYTSLFNRAPKDCSFISAEALAKAMNVSVSKITAENKGCTYVVQEENGEETRLHFKIESWGNKTVMQEIKTAKKNAENFGEDSILSQYRISETGDTYLSMHQSRMIRILNEVNDNVIILLYTPKIDPAESNVAILKKIKSDATIKAYTIANYLLNNHRS